MDFSKLLKKPDSINKKEPTNSNTGPWEHGHVFFKGNCAGVRTCAWTGDSKLVKLQFEIRWYAGSLNHLSLYLVGGPTGYESCSLEDAYRILEMKKGWHACAGTSKRWDALFIPDSVMLDILDKWDVVKGNYNF